MKKTLILVAVFMLVAAVAFAGISTTKHNLASGGGQATRSTNVAEICVFCHTPHGSNTGMTAAPLWNRANTATVWTAYNNTSMNGTATTGGDISKACLSCHDGNVGDELLVNGPGSGYGTTAPGWQNQTFSTLANLNDTPSLDNDHPIGMSVNSGDAYIYGSSAIIANGLPLYGANTDTVECASCHAVHDDTNSPFLRMSNSASAMCLACHNK